jgi:hypothetical protein
MADYSRIYNLTVKDSLPTGNSAKVIKGAELDAELNAVASAIASKADSNSPTFTGTPSAPTASYGTSTTQLATTAFVQQALQALYPVGSIYINATSSTNPATLFGFGTWVAFGEGRVIVGQSASDALFDTLEETGGTKDSIVVSHTHTLSGTTSSNGAHTHSISDPGHTHFVPSGAPVSSSIRYETSGAAYGGSQTTGSSTTGISVQSNGAHTHTLTGTTDSTGSSGTNANVQPYIVAKLWKRTA